MFDTERIGTSPQGRPLEGLRLGAGPSALLVASPTGLDTPAAGVLPALLERLSADSRGYRWSVVLCADPDGASRNPAVETLDAALTSLFYGTRPDCETARGEGPIAAWCPAPSRTVWLRAGLFGPMPGDADGDVLRIYRFTHPNCSDSAPQQHERRNLVAPVLKTALEEWEQEYPVVRPFLSRECPHRPWLDRHVDRTLRRIESLEGMLNTAGECYTAIWLATLCHLRAIGQLVAAARWEVEQGHTVPALMGVVRPLGKLLASRPEAWPVAQEAMQETLLAQFESRFPGTLSGG